MVKVVNMTSTMACIGCRYGIVTNICIGGYPLPCECDLSLSLSLPLPLPPSLRMHRVLCSAGKDLKGSVFLEALAAREEPNRNGKMTVSLFLE